MDATYVQIVAFSIKFHRLFWTSSIWFLIVSFLLVTVRVPYSDWYHFLFVCVAGVRPCSVYGSAGGRCTCCVPLVVYGLTL
jgi:hypothetical protein